jgi:dynein heavy chain 2
LSNHDLRKDKNIWLSKLEQIKGYVEMACQDKDAKYCKKWKTHCDVQLYKVMEMQFLTGLDDSDSVLPEINVEVVLKNKMIQFKPSIEELKDKYYREITNFITWPARVFKGILGNL